MIKISLSVGYGFGFENWLLVGFNLKMVCKTNNNQYRIIGIHGRRGASKVKLDQSLVLLGLRRAAGGLRGTSSASDKAALMTILVKLSNILRSNSPSEMLADTPSSEIQEKQV